MKSLKFLIFFILLNNLTTNSLSFKDYFRYVAGGLLVYGGTKSMSEEENFMRNNQSFNDDFRDLWDETSFNKLLMSAGVINAVNTYLRKDDLSKNVILNYLISSVLILKSLKESNIENLNRDQKQKITQAKVCGYVVGTGLGLIGSNLMLDFAN